MPASREKQPGWLMIGKCGATVKGAGSGAAITRFSAGWLCGWSGPQAQMGPLGPEPAPDAADLAKRDRISAADPAGLRDERGALGRRDIRRRRLMLAAALEQHPSLEAARTQERIAGQHAFTHRRQMRSHQSNRLHETRVQPRLTPGLLQKHPAIERLMLGPNDGQPVVGVESRPRPSTPA